MYNSFTSNSAKGGNLGSCKALAKYLDKETKNKWFSHDLENVKTDTVVRQIDKFGKGGIHKKYWRFCEIEYAPSTKEIKHLIQLVTGKSRREIRRLKDWSELSEQEQEEVKVKFLEFVRECQDLQAQNYNREGINTGADLKWYAKIETQRKWKYEKEVQEGKHKRGELKKGFHLHCHIIQSRKAMNKKTQLSPLSTQRKQSADNPVQQGFDRNVFTNSVEEKFDNMFNYQREMEECYEVLKYEKKMRESVFVSGISQHMKIRRYPNGKYLKEKNKYLKSLNFDEQQLYFANINHYKKLEEEEKREQERNRKMLEEVKQEQIQKQQEEQEIRQIRFRR